MSIDGECFFIYKDDFPYELLMREKQGKSEKYIDASWQESP